MEVNAINSKPITETNNSSAAELANPDDKDKLQKSITNLLQDLEKEEQQFEAAAKI